MSVSTQFYISTVPAKSDIFSSDVGFRAVDPSIPLFDISIRSAAIALNPTYKTTALIIQGRIEERQQRFVCQGLDPLNPAYADTTFFKYNTASPV